MSTGIWHRLEQAFERALQHHDRDIGRNAIMSAFSHLKACIAAGNARISDLEAQLAAAKAQPAGTSDGDLDTLASSIESVLGTSVPDPDASNLSDQAGGAAPSQQPPADQAHLSEPAVGNGSTTVSDPATGNTTTLDHASGSATTTDASGVTVTTDQAAADAAKAAASAAGVAVPTT